MTTTATSQSSIGAFLEESQGRSSNFAAESQSSSFQEHMENAADGAEPSVRGDVTDFGSAAGSDTDSISVPAGGQESQNGTLVLASQISSAGRVTPAASASIAASPWATPLEGRSIAAVRQAMVNEGLDPDSVKMTYSADLVWAPDGSWVNELLTIETDEGRKQDFSANLSLDSPQVTVCDVRHMLDGTAGWDQWDHLA